LVKKVQIQTRRALSNLGASGSAELQDDDRISSEIAPADDLVRA
jgi:hypothetical protein